MFTQKFCFYSVSVLASWPFPSRSFCVKLWLCSHTHITLEQFWSMMNDESSCYLRMQSSLLPIMKMSAKPSHFDRDEQTWEENRFKEAAGCRNNIKLSALPPLFIFMWLWESWWTDYAYLQNALFGTPLRSNSSCWRSCNNAPFLRVAAAAGCVKVIPRRMIQLAAAAAKDLAKIRALLPTTAADGRIFVPGGCHNII